MRKKCSTASNTFSVKMSTLHSTLQHNFIVHIDETNKASSCVIYQAYASPAAMHLMTSSVLAPQQAHMAEIRDACVWSARPPPHAVQEN
jgi:hypothetical protein